MAVIRSRKPRVWLRPRRYCSSEIHSAGVVANEFGCVKIETKRMIGRAGRDPSNWPSLPATAVSGSKNVEAYKTGTGLHRADLVSLPQPAEPAASGNRRAANRRIGAGDRLGDRRQRCAD